jgi:hypothetical protein
MPQPGKQRAEELRHINMVPGAYRSPTPWATPSTAVPTETLDRALAAADISSFPAAQCQRARGKYGLGFAYHIKERRFALRECRHRFEPTARCH